MAIVSDSWTVWIRVEPESSLRDGSPWFSHVAPWEHHDWRPQSDAHPLGTFVDPGPSPAGNPGPYLKVPYYEDGLPFARQYDTRHRIYPRWGMGGLPRRTLTRSVRLECAQEAWWWVVEPSAPDPEVS